MLGKYSPYTWPFTFQRATGELYGCTPEPSGCTFRFQVQVHTSDYKHPPKKTQNIKVVTFSLVSGYSDRWAFYRKCNFCSILFQRTSIFSIDVIKSLPGFPKYQGLVVFNQYADFVYSILHMMSDYVFFPRRDSLWERFRSEQTTDSRWERLVNVINSVTPWGKKDLCVLLVSLAFIWGSVILSLFLFTSLCICKIIVSFLSFTPPLFSLLFLLHYTALYSLLITLFPSLLGFSYLIHTHLSFCCHYWCVSKQKQDETP